MPVKKPDAETLKTSNLNTKIICRPPQSRETISLNCKTLNLYNYVAKGKINYYKTFMIFLFLKTI